MDARLETRGFGWAWSLSQKGMYLEWVISVFMNGFICEDFGLSGLDTRVIPQSSTRKSKYVLL